MGFRVRLPVDSWTQRYMHIGCGGLCGSISAATDPGVSYNCPLTQQGGFVLSSTNMGHTNAETTWTQDAQRRADFAYRGVHVTTLAAKKLIAAFSIGFPGISPGTAPWHPQGLRLYACP